MATDENNSETLLCTCLFLICSDKNVKSLCSLSVVIYRLSQSKKYLVIILLFEWGCQVKPVIFSVGFYVQSSDPKLFVFHLPQISAKIRRIQSQSQISFKSYQ